MRLGLSVSEDVSAGTAAGRSRALALGPLPGDAELHVAVLSDRAQVLGSFQRPPTERRETPPRFRRGSGGPSVWVGPGTVHVALALSSPSALLSCDAHRIVNRYVRPLLKALALTGSPAAFFGRDWIAVRGQPVAWVGFGHDSTTRRTLFEAFVAVAEPFALEARTSFRGKVPTTLDSMSGRRTDSRRLASAIGEAYAALAGEAHPVAAEPSAGDALRLEAEPPPEPPWSATGDEVIGLIGAGPDARGTFRVGGDLLVSRDALEALERRLPATPDDEVGRAVDETLGAPAVALDGVRSLTSVRDVILRARAVAGR